MIRNAPPLKVTDNVSILNAIRNDAGWDYQSRIPAATQANIQDTVRQLTSYRPSFNEFIDILVNRIGLNIFRHNSWSNPLAEFKLGQLEYGDTIEETMVGLLKAHRYDPDRDYGGETLFTTELPEVQANFHRVNRQDFYKVTVNEDLLKRAFLTSSGVANLVTSLMEAPYTSDSWDEFLTTCRLFAEYESHGGFYNMRIPEVSAMESNEEDAKYALRRMRAMASTLRFISPQYNAAKMPVSAKPEDLVIFTTPEFNAAVDVNALAAAFNIDRASIYGRIIPIPREQFGIDGVEAIMTTKDFFLIADQRFEMTSQYNPVPGQTNFFLHHWQLISCSRFVPAIAFNTRVDDEVINVKQNLTAVTAIEITELADGSVPTEAVRETRTPLKAIVTGSTTPEGYPLADSVAWSVAGGTSERTYITSTGVLHVGGDENAETINVTARTTYLDPDNVRLDGLTRTLALTVSGEKSPGWPERGELAGIKIAGVEVAGVAPGTATYALTLPKGTTVKNTDVKVSTRNSASVKTTVAPTAGGYTVTISVDPGRGAAVTYTVNVTVPA